MRHALNRWLGRLLLRPEREDIGRWGERVAESHLRRQGYRILGRNLRSRLGEIDLLAEDPDGHTVVVVEVKSGRGGSIPPEVHVSPAKQRKLVALASHVMRKARLTDRPVRFDVVGIDFIENGSQQIRHHRGAFESHG